MSERREHRWEVSTTRPSPGPDHPPLSFGSAAGGGFAGEVRDYMDIVRRRLGWIKGVFIAVFLLTLAATLFQSRVYRATALVEIRGEGEGIPSIDGLFAGQEPSEEYLRTHFGLLRSTTLAHRVIQDLALDTLEVLDPDGEGNRQKMVERFLERLVIDPVEESRLVRVSFEAPTAELSAEVVNAIVETHARLRVEAHEDVARRLAFQVDSVETRLAASESELRTYADEQGLPFLVDEDLSAQIGTRLTDLRERLTAAEASRYESESRYEVVVSEGRTDAVEDPVVAELDLQLAQLRRDYARLSATFTDAFPATADLRRQIEQLRGLIGEERARLARRVESDYRMAVARESRLADAIEREEDLASQLGPQSGEYHLLRQSVLSNRNLYSSLHEKRREAEVAAAVGSTDLILVDPAAPPTGPHRPVFAMNLGLGVMLGLVLGVGAAFMRELTDDTVQTADDLPITGSMPVLALIPEMEANGPLVGRRQHKRLYAGPGVARPGGLGERRSRNGMADRVQASVLADAFGSLRASVLLKDEEAAPRSILVSSCRAGEGKTTVSLNLAMSLAELGNRVLIIDADLRRPSIHLALGLRSSPGLVDCLARGRAWKDIVKRSVAEGLDVLTSGGTTIRAGELIASDRLEPLLREAEAEYDFVIVDAPALFINASDARFLARAVDGVVVVVRSRSTPRALVDRLPDAAPNLLGVVVNDLRRTSLPDYYGDYFSHYGEADGERGSP